MVGVVVLLSIASEVVVNRYRRIRLSTGRGEPKRLLWTPLDVAVVAVLVAFSATRLRGRNGLRDVRPYLRRPEPSARLGSPRKNTSTQEVGYTSLSLLVKSTFGNSGALLWVTALLTVVPVYAVIKRKSTNVTLAVMLYVLLAFYVAPFNIIRQGVAVSLMFWAYASSTEGEAG